MSYWAPRSDAPICVCGGGACKQKTDCRRYLERNANQWSEKYLIAPVRYVRMIDAHGRPINETQQVCECFMPREGQ